MQNVKKIILSALLFPAPKFCAEGLFSCMNLQLSLKIHLLLRYEHYKLLDRALRFQTEALNMRQCQHQSAKTAAVSSWRLLRRVQGRMVPEG